MYPQPRPYSGALTRLPCVNALMHTDPEEADVEVMNCFFLLFLMYGYSRAVSPDRKL